MASNELPKAQAPLLTLAEDMADGLHVHEVPVGVHHNTEIKMRAWILALRQAEENFQAKTVVKGDGVTAQTVADSNGKSFIKSARKVLSVTLGERWSEAWSDVGFPDHSTAVPSTIAKRQELLARLRDYFTANAARENAGLNVTAARAGLLFTALSDARSALNETLNQLGALKVLRDQKDADLRTGMTNLIGELEQLLDPLDPLWEAFGLNPPGAVNPPDVPESLVLTAGAAGTVVADWADASRALRYHIWVMILTVDTEYQNVLTREVSDATLTDLPSGKTIKVRITAVNDTGESQPGEEMEIVVA